MRDNALGMAYDVVCRCRRGEERRPGRAKLASQAEAANIDSIKLTMMYVERINHDVLRYDVTRSDISTSICHS